MKKKCKIEGCEKEATCKQMCKNHYASWYRTGDPIPRKQPRIHKVCSVEGCEEKHRRNGYCATHSHRYYRHGDPLAVYPNKQTEEEQFVSLKKRQKKYNKTDKGKAASKRKIHRRRHLEASDVQLSTEDYQYIFKKFDNRCFNCGSRDLITFDHHIPLSKGGKLTRSNVVLLCHDCNSKKGNKDPEEFYSEEQLKLLNLLKSIK